MTATRTHAFDVAFDNRRFMLCVPPVGATIQGTGAASSVRRRWNARSVQPADAPAWVYLLHCARDDTLYTGWTTDLGRRIAAHRAGTASRYTRTRLPVELAAAFPMADAGCARREEARIKRMTRGEKLALIAAQARAGNADVSSASPEV
jgi:putative endonuclease